MDSLNLIAGALFYIEANLTSEVKTEDIAGALYCSRSSLEKHFRYMTDLSIRDYCIRRRMTLAAREMTACPEKSLLDIAVTYGYGSHEAFTRAFRQVWHMSPSEYRKAPLKSTLFPAIRIEKEIMEDKTMREKRKPDISELYDCIKARRGSYVVGADIKGLAAINEIAAEAGDLVILEALRRLEGAAGEDDLVFRVGGDEFVLLTASTDERYAKGVIDAVQSRNWETVAYQGQDIPLNLHMTCFRLEEKPLKYSELFMEVQNRLKDAKKI